MQSELGRFQLQIFKIIDLINPKIKTQSLSLNY